MFHDGRVSISDIYENTFDTPAQEWLPRGLNSLLAAQALFPMTSPAEMAGQPGENEIAGAANDRIDAVWPLVAARVRAIPEYGRLFTRAFDEIDGPGQITIVQIVNAIAAFIGTEFRSFDSPFDRFLAGDTAALSPQEERGMTLFFGDIGCSACHSGPLLGDQKFYALALPQFGPGRTRPFDPVARDVGRMGASDALEDAYRFRTPFLRNVALTGPYGHNGAMPTLDAMLRQHSDPLGSSDAWRPEMANLTPVPWLAATDFVIRQDRLETARQRRAVDIDLPALSDAAVADIVAFLGALTGKAARQRLPARPDTVPSGLPVD